MSQPITNTSLSSQPLFPSYSAINEDITALALEFLAKSVPLHKFTELALINKRWKMFIMSEKVFRIIFNTHLRSYSNYLKPKAPLSDEVKRIYSNLYATRFAAEAQVLSPKFLDFFEEYASTDGKKWFGYVTDSTTLWIRNGARLELAPQKVITVKMPTYLKRIAISEDTIAVILSTGSLLIYDASKQPPSQIGEFHLGENLERFSFIKDGFIYRNEDGEIFYQSNEKTNLIQLPTAEYNEVERPPPNRLSTPIPFFISKGGYYLALSDEVASNQRHYWQLRHLDQKDPIITLPFTTDPNWAIDLTGRYLVALHTRQYDLHLYSLPLPENQKQGLHVKLKELSDDFFMPFSFLKIWGSYLVIGELGRVRIVSLSSVADRKPAVIREVFYNDRIHLTGHVYINPDGLNFIVRKFGASPLSYFRGFDQYTLSSSLLHQSLDVSKDQGVKKRKSGGPAKNTRDSKK